MQRYVALLRAVNVGGTGKLPMAELRDMCRGCGFTDVQTYIASGNAVFSTADDAEDVAARLEARLQDYAGKPVAVMVRQAGELEAVLADNPFPDAAPNKVAILFLKTPAKAAMLEAVSGGRDEELAIGAREIYIHYPSGMGPSRLKIAVADQGTARNVNTVRKLALMAGQSV